MNHLRIKPSNITLYLILSYLFFSFISPWCHIHNDGHGQFAEEEYHFHSPYAYNIRQQEASEEDEHHDDDHHLLALHQSTFTLLDKIIAHPGYYHVKKEKPASHTPTLLGDTEVHSFTSNSHYTIGHSSSPVYNAHKVFTLFYTDLSPPVCEVIFL